MVILSTSTPPNAPGLDKMSLHAERHAHINT